MNSFLSMLFGRNNGLELAASGATAAAAMEPYQGMLLDGEDVLSSRKRSLADVSVSKRTGTIPKLVPTPGQEEENEAERPLKRFRGDSRAVSVTPSEEQSTRLVETKAETTVPACSPFQTLPEDVVAHCLSFLGSVEDRFALQCTSKQFRRISNTETLLSTIEVGGDKLTGLHGLIQDHDTPETASGHLTPYVAAGNLEAIYM
jgi:hypothetical protein